MLDVKWIYFRLWCLSFAIITSESRLATLILLLSVLLPRKLRFITKLFHRDVISCPEVRKKLAKPYIVLEVKRYENGRLKSTRKILVCEKCALALLP